MPPNGPKCYINKEESKEEQIDYASTQILKIFAFVRHLPPHLNLYCLLLHQGLFTGTALLTAGQKCTHPTRRPVLSVMTASLNQRYADVHVVVIVPIS